MGDGRPGTRVLGLDWVTLMSYAGALLAFSLAVVIIRLGRGERSDRILVGLLLFEGIVQATFSTAGFGATPSRWEESWVAVGLWATSVLGALYLLFIAVLDTPIVAWLRRVGPRRAIVGVLAGIPTVALLGVAAVMTGDTYAPGSRNFAVTPLAFGTIAFVIICVYALVAAVSALRRAPPGPRRAQARAYVIAFGARDVLFFIGIGSNLLAEAIVPGVGIGESDILTLSKAAGALATVVFVPLLTYGLLKTQLFDIDLRIKWGISRGTVAGIILVAVFVGAKLVESYLNRTAGVVAGSIVAGALLFLVPKLNKVGEKVANTAMPQVQPTSGYVQFKKLEVYRAAVEASQETGGIGERERASLDRLRVKLGLDAADCRAVEGEVPS